MPQDEYDHAHVLDDWLQDLDVGHVFTNFGTDVRGVLYPHLSTHAGFEHVFTGYIDDDTALRLEPRLARPERRPFDVVYRAAHLPYWFGSLGQLKHRIGERAEAEARARQLIADVSTRTEDAILGPEWFDFLAAGRVVVGCESGSSVLDRRGEIKSAITAYLDTHPGASFDEVSWHLPEGWDSYHFAAVGPRHFEAVISRTAQVLVQGRYDGVLEPGRHYLPVRQDLSDLGDALERASDPALAGELADRSYEEIYRSGRYGYHVLAEKIDSVLATRAPRRDRIGLFAASIAAQVGASRMGTGMPPDGAWTLAADAEPTAGAFASALRGKVSRRLLRAYIAVRRAAGPALLGGLLAEGRLLDRMAAVQRSAPHSPGFRVVRAVRRGASLELTVLRPAAVAHKNSAGDPATPPDWPPESIVLRVPPGRVTSKADGRGAGGSELWLDAVSTLARLHPDGVRAALFPLLDPEGGPRSRPRERERRERMKRGLATVRLLVSRPVNLWWLAAAIGRAPLGDTADDLLKLSLLTSSPSGVARTELDAGGELERLVWDHRAVSRYVFAPIAFGKRVTVWLGAAGVHEFTALERLPSRQRRAILRRLER